LQSLQQAQQIVHHLAPRMAFSSELFNRALLQASLQKFQLDSTLVNLTSESNQHYNLVIKNASFDHLMACLIELSEQYDVQVMQANLTTTGAGLVSGEMVLQGH
jgi:type II secretory pathway component PulM